MEYYKIPSWASKISYNYRGNIILMSESGEIVKEIAVSNEGLIVQ